MSTWAPAAIGDVPSEVVQGRTLALMAFDLRAG